LTSNFQDGGHYVISRKKVLPSASDMQQRPPAAR